MLEMFFSWRDENMWLKTLSITLLTTLAFWEPVRLVILLIRKKWKGLKWARRRIGLILLSVIPYAFFVGYARIYTEDHFNVWGVPVANFTSYSFSIGITLLFVLLQVAVYESTYFFDEWNKSKTEADELKKINFEIRFDSLKVQIQPHFLFNTLNTLIGLMKIDTKRAIRFTEEMAHVYRYLLEANERQLIVLEEEMKFAQAYFFLLKTRYNEGLHLEINGEVDMSGYQLPPLSLQVLIENSVKHNITTRERPLYVRIDFQPALKQVVVSNNLQRKPKFFNSGTGLKNLKKRFALMSVPGLKIIEDEYTFSVTIPLIKSDEHESSDH